MLQSAQMRISRPPVPRYARVSRRARVRERELFAYQWRGIAGRAGFADEIINRYPRAARAWFDVELGVIDAPWENKPVPNETPAEAALRERIDALLREEMRTDLNQSIAGLQGGWTKFLTNAASVLKYGAAPFERSWWDDETASLGDGMRLELYHVHPSSIQDYLDDDQFGLSHIKQSVDGGTHLIPADKLVMISPMGAAGEYEGWTPLRSLGFIVELAWQLALSTARRGRLDAGMFALKETEPGAAEMTIDDIEQALDEIEAGQQLSGFIPHGMELGFHSPTSSGLNAVEIWKYVDGQVDHVIGAWVASLGLTAGSGSRALGDTLSVQDSKRWRRTLNLIGSGVSSMYRDLACDLGYPSSIRVPTLCVREEDEVVSLERLTASVQAGVSSGVLPVVPELTREFAARSGLSDETVEAMVAAKQSEVAQRSVVREVEQPVSLEVAPASFSGLNLAEDSFTPPESVRANARRGLELRRKHGRGGTQVGVARARDLANGNVSRKTIGRMRSFFARHAVDEKSRDEDQTSAANIAWLLWGGDSGRNWVQSQRFDAMFSDAGSYGEQLDAAGKPVEFFREFEDVERIVEWVDNAEQRDSLELDYRFRMEDVRDKHVEDLRSALDNAGGLTDQQLKQLLNVVLAQYIEEYTGIILDHVFSVEQMTEASASRERERTRPVSGPAPDEDAQRELRAFAAGQVASMRQGVERQGEIAARRVQEDVLDQFEAQVPIRSIVSRIGRDGLSTHGSKIANRAESMGRIIEGAVSGGELVPVEAFRTSVSDKARCPTCERRDSGKSGKTWSLRTAEDVQRFIDDPEATCPDPDCDGRTNCRCGHLLRYARVPRVDMSAGSVRRVASLADLEELLRG